MLSRSLLFAVSVCSAALMATVAQAESLEGSRPNIVLVMTDDQGLGDLACMGNPVLQTPHLDRFYEKSTRFTDFHVSPTCAPTRSAIMSGRHEFKNGITHTIKERERMALSTTTLPQLLQKNGYQTGIFGKWHLGDEDEYQPYNRGFGEVFIHGAGGIGQSYEGSCADFPPNQPDNYFDPAILHNDTIVKTKGFCTDLFFEAALGWISEQQESKKHFFAYISTNAPHGPMIADAAYKERFLAMGYDEDTAGRYGMIENIDDNMGLLMQKFDEWNIWEDTLVIFMTDNGQAGLRARKNGERVKIFTTGFKSGKGSPYEGGTHVPAFWRWDSVLKEGKDIPKLTAHLDLFPTFCDLAGIEIPDDIQEVEGRSLLPLLENPKAKWKDRLLFIHRGRWEKGEDPNTLKHRVCGVRTQRWRLVNHTELYDIAHDPYEEHDVASEFPNVVKRLQRQYDKWWESTLPLMVNEDVPYSEVHPQVVRYNKQKEERGIPAWEPPLKLPHMTVVRRETKMPYQQDSQ
ncbi:N-acetylgalactosamine-6-sulfatase [Planctomycetales bacterium 10988]|nr:N-acetylgalactosamine-6-sulfatase [Planctomycetales bacterium 10988]